MFDYQVAVGEGFGPVYQSTETSPLVTWPRNDTCRLSLVSAGETVTPLNTCLYNEIADTTFSTTEGELDFDLVS